MCCLCKLLSQVNAVLSFIGVRLMILINFFQDFFVFNNEINNLINQRWLYDIKIVMIAAFVTHFLGYLYRVLFQIKLCWCSCLRRRLTSQITSNLSKSADKLFHEICIILYTLVFSLFVWAAIITINNSTGMWYCTNQIGPIPIIAVLRAKCLLDRYFINKIGKPHD